ncbi:MAG: lipid A deacylase LpxR family protein [Sedimentisphaerales bacterium]|nr:lipid A deacylase LpxR family protein [Sedimentisphaerales bacterium]
MKKYICVFWICLLFFPSFTTAKSFSVYWENDSRFHKPNGHTDRHYTNGFRMVYTAQPEWDWLKDFETWFDFGGGQDVTTAVGLSLGQNIYTPDRIEMPQLRRPDDMKYSGWLYTGWFAQRATDRQLEHFELNLGVIGPTAHADDVQSEIHDWLHSDKPLGWENQLGDEFAFDFIYRSRIKWTDSPLAGIKNLEVIPEYGFTLGSVHRQAALGLLFRYGWSLPGDFGPGRLELPTTEIGKSLSDPASFYLFCRAGGRLVEHNRFLTGLDEKPLVGELQVGAVYHRKWLEVGYSQTFFTREYKEQHANDSFGAFTVTLLF